jgi:hypothetical protein
MEEQTVLTTRLVVLEERDIVYLVYRRRDPRRRFG